MMMIMIMMIMVVNKISSDMLLVNGGVLMVLPLEGTPWALVPSLRKVGQAVCVYMCSPHEKEKHTHIYEETRLTVSGLLIEKVPQSEEDNEYCMVCDEEPGKQGTWGEWGFLAHPPACSAAAAQCRPA